MALPIQILQFFLYFLILLRAHRIIFYESQQLCNPVIKSSAQFIIPLSAQIASSKIGIAHWQREAAEAKRTSREAWTQMAEMRDKYTELLAQLDHLRRYEKHMPEEMRKELASARRETMRMIYGDFER